MIFTILPFLFMIALLGMVIWFVMRTAGSNNFFKKKLVFKSLLGAYLAVLIASIVVFEVLPKNNNDLLSVNAKEANEISSRFYEMIFEGNKKDIDPALIQKEWELEYEGKKLELSSLEGNFKESVIVKRKAENDGKIEGTYYSSLIMNGTDYTDVLMPIDLSLEEDTLNIIGIPEGIDLHFAMYKNEFVINQFTGEKSWMDPNHDGYSNIQVLYLEIPKDLELIDTHGMGINYVENGHWQ